MKFKDEQDDLQRGSVPGEGGAGTWVFDERVAARFRDMFRRSIPDLAALREIVADIAAAKMVMEENAVGVDLGCSLGDQIGAIRELTRRGDWYAVDSSAAMIERAAERFRGTPSVTVVEGDLASGDLWDELGRVGPIDVVTMLMTLQFVGDDRAKRDVLRRIREVMSPYGRLILAEKVHLSSRRIGSVITTSYEDYKEHRGGYSKLAIHLKKEALRDVMIPSDESVLEGMLASTGFRAQRVWQNREFVCWAATVDP